MDRLTIKSKEELAVMREGGKILSEVKGEIKKMLKPGVSADEVEEKTNELIEKAGGKASFKMVEGYKWATCVNVNAGVVHGIPHARTVFKQGDVVSVDLGVYHKAFHTDTSFSVLLGNDSEKEKFLEVGKRALEMAIKEAKVGKRVGDITRKMEEIIRKAGYRPVKTLTGHGIGKELHEDPRVPCLILGTVDEAVELKEGMTLAIEVMYTLGSEELKLESDGWTISTKDGKIAALFEETVAITKTGSEILTT